jgi:hypothetical protein
LTLAIQIKRLLVEGKDDLYAVRNLMSAYIDWPKEENKWPVVIEDCGGVESILEPEFIPTLLQSSEVKTLGIVIDANDDFVSRWRLLRDRCLSVFSGLPDDLPSSGLILDNQEKRLGIWIMPDNTSGGMLEDFLRWLVPSEAEPLWRQAQANVAEAKAKNAPFLDAHVAKANIHTWLAWQDPPGQPLGLALTRKILDPQSPKASAFVEWFRKLYSL